MDAAPSTKNEIIKLCTFAPQHRLSISQLESSEVSESVTYCIFMSCLVKGDIFLTRKNPPDEPNLKNCPGLSSITLCAGDSVHALVWQPMFCALYIKLGL